MSNGVAYEHYRNSTIGKSLMDTLDDLVARNAVTPQLARKILANFDAAIMDSLAERTSGAKLTFKGDLDTYRFCDDVWTFLMKNVTFKFPQSHLDPVKADKITIVAMSSKRVLES